MELKQVHELIERYFEGETSLKEEMALEAYFSKANIDHSLAQYAPYFKTILQQRNERSSKNFMPNYASKFSRWKVVSAIAASFVVGFFVFQQTVFIHQPTAEEIAFEEFKLNMYLVAEHLNKGKQGVAYMETFNQTTDKYLKTK